MSKIIVETLKIKLKDLDVKYDKLKAKIYSTPVSEICELRNQFNSKKEELGYDSKEFLDWLKFAAKKEKELFSLARWQSDNRGKAIDDLIKLEFEIKELRNELYYKERRDKW
jgi:hypothetical protein